MIIKTYVTTRMVCNYAWRAVLMTFCLFAFINEIVSFIIKSRRCKTIGICFKTLRGECFPYLYKKLGNFGITFWKFWFRFKLRNKSCISSDCHIFWLLLFLNKYKYIVLHGSIRCAVEILFSPFKKALGVYGLNWLFLNFEWIILKLTHWKVLLIN